MEDKEWIENFEKHEKPYDIFYKEPLNFVKCVIIRVNSNNEIVHIDVKRIYINNNTLEFTQIKKAIPKQYKLRYLVKYNFTLEPNHIQDYIVSPPNVYNFLSSASSSPCNNIHWKDTISFFHGLNTLYAICSEYIPHTTRRIKVRNAKRFTRRSNKNQN